MEHTQMTKAPKRIWATGNAHYGSWNSVEVRNADHQVQYIHEDHVDALLKAEREKALREAAAVCSAAIKSYGMMKPGKPDQYASREAQIVAKGFARLIEQDIEALIEKDATDG